MKVLKKSLFPLIIVVVVFALGGCKKNEFIQKAKDSFHLVKEETLETIRVRLSGVPFIKKYIHLPPPPASLYNSTQNLISDLKSLKADQIYPDKFKEVLDVWEEADRLYRYKYYFKASKKLQEVKKKAEILKKDLLAYWDSLKQKAWERYKQVEKQANKILQKKNLSAQEKLKVELYLWKLRALISLKRFDKFDEELKNKPF